MLKNLALEKQIQLLLLLSYLQVLFLVWSYIINTPGEAGAFQKTPWSFIALIKSLSDPFVQNLHDALSQTVRAEILRECSPPFPCVTCHMSSVLYQVSIFFL